MKLPLVMIEWADAEGDSAWAECGDMDDFCNNLSIATDVGWIYEENDEMVVLVSSFFGDGTFGSRIKIPKGMIKSKKRLGFRNGHT